jgi:hypothetical protein
VNRISARWQAALSLVVVSPVRRSTAAALALTALIGVAVLPLLRPVVRSLDTAAVGDTSGWSLEMAVNRTWCGRYPYLTSTISENAARIDLMHLSVRNAGTTAIRNLIISGAGSLADYCRMEGQRAPFHEASMILVESALLTTRRLISLPGLAYGLAGLAHAGFLTFAFVLLKLRWPAVFVAGVVAAAMYMTALLGGNALYSPYPLILPTLLVGIGIGGLCLGYKIHRWPALFLTAAFVLGVWTGFLGNLRTSCYPAAALITCLFIGVAAVDWREVARPSTGTLAAATCAAVLAAVAGVATFDRLFIAPIRAVDAPGHYSYHVVMHPLVLGLATLPNELATREHLKWDDTSGVEAAQRIDPSVTYLGPGYERALFAYYVQLWRRNPAAMAGIYFRKLTDTRRKAEEFLKSYDSGLFWPRKDGRWLAAAAWPALRIASVAGMTGLFGGLMAVGYFRPAGLAMDRARGFCVMAIAVSGFLGFVESAVVLSGVVLWYSSLYLFALVFAGLFVYQGAVDACWRRWTLTVSHR